MLPAWHSDQPSYRTNRRVSLRTLRSVRHDVEHRFFPKTFRQLLRYDHRLRSQHRQEQCTIIHRLLTDSLHEEPESTPWAGMQVDAGYSQVEFLCSMDDFLKLKRSVAMTRLRNTASSRYPILISIETAALHCALWSASSVLPLPTEEGTSLCFALLNLLGLLLEIPRVPTEYTA